MQNLILKTLFKQPVCVEYFHNEKDVAARHRLHRNIRIAINDGIDLMGELTRALDALDPSQRKQACFRLHKISTWRKRLSFRAASSGELIARHDEIASMLCWLAVALEWTASALEHTRPSNLDVRRHIVTADQFCDQLAGLRNRIDDFDTCIGLR